MNILQRALQFLTGNNRSIIDDYLRTIKVNLSGGISITPESSMGLSSVYSAVKLISESIAAMPSNVYRETPSGKEVARTHDQWRLIKKSPHPFYTAYIWKRTMLVHYLLWGDGYSRIIRNGETGRPESYELWMPWETETFVENGKIFHRNSKLKVTVVDADMIHISDLSYDGLTGESRISLAADSLGEGLSQTKLGKRFFENGTMLGGYLKYQKTLTKEKLDLYRTTFKNAYGGVDKAGEVGALDEGTEFVPFKLSMPMNDAQWVENKKLKISDVARIFNLPPSKLGDTDSNSYASIEQQNISAVQDCYLPIVVMFESELDRKIFKSTETEFYVKFEMKGLLRGDTATRTAFLQMGLDRGMFSINDALAIEDMNPVPNGDKRFVQLNMIPLDRYDEYVNSMIKSSQDGK